MPYNTSHRCTGNPYNGNWDYPEFRIHGTIPMARVLHARTFLRGRYQFPVSIAEADESMQKKHPCHIGYFRQKLELTMGARDPSA